MSDGCVLRKSIRSHETARSTSVTRRTRWAVWFSSGLLTLLAPGSLIAQTTTTTVGSGDWGSSVNWSTGAPVNNTFDAVVNGYAMNLEASYTINSLTMTTGSISGAANMSLTMGGPSTWTAGTLGTGVGGSLNFNSDLTINNTSSLLLATPAMNLSGTTNWTGTGSIISTLPNASINNLAGALFTTTGTQSFLNSYTGTFNNNAGATFRTLYPAATTTVQWAFNNSGTVEVQPQTSLILQGGGTWGGTTTVYGNGTLTLGSNTFTLQNGGTTSLLGTMNISGATVNLDNNATYTFNNSGLLQLSSGSLASGGNASSVLNLNSPLIWTGGSLGAQGTINSFGAQINTAGSVSLNTPNLFISGNWQFINTGSVIAVTPNAAITALSGSTFTINGSGSFLNSYTGTFNNQSGATFYKNGAGTSSIQWVFNNAGTLNVSNGSLNFSGGGSLGGSIQVSNASSTIAFNSGTYTLENNGSASMTGTFSINGATLNMANGGTYNVPTAGFSLVSGSLGGGGDSVSVLNLGGLNWTGGSLGGPGTINIGGGFYPNGNGSKLVASPNIVFGNAASTGWYGSGAIIAAAPSAALTNYGAFFIYGDAAMANSYTGTFNNYGNVQKETATGTTSIQWIFNNFSQVNGNSGTISFSGGGSLGGAVYTSGTGSVAFTSGSYTLQDTSGMVNSGNSITLNADFPIGNNATYLIGSNTPLGIILAGGNLGSGGNANSVLNLAANVNWTGGNLGGNGTTNFSNNNTISGSGSKGVATANLINNGTLNWTGSGIIIAVAPNAAITNNGTFDAQSDASLVNSYNGTFNNNTGGVFTKSAGAGVTAVQWAFNNSGEVRAGSGTIAFQGTYTQSPTGFITLNGGNVTFSNGISIQGGIQGSGGITAPTLGQGGGSISPGFSPGQMNLTTNLTLSSTSTLVIELAGLAQGTQYDFLNVTGSAALNNAVLNLTLYGGFENTIANGDTFTILTASTGLTGIFNNLPDGTLFTSNDNLSQFEIHYTGNSVILTVAVPEPATIALMAGTVLAAGTWYWRRRSKLKMELSEDVVCIDE